MRLRFFIAFVAAAVTAVVLAASAQASCIPSTAAENRARASVVFDGVALEGATPTGVQRFRVTRYLKGSGPAVVRVNTGHIRRADGTRTFSSVSLMVKRSERWRIYARGAATSILQSNMCAGSQRLRS